MPVKVVGRESIEKELEGTLRLKSVRESLKLREDQYISLVNGVPATDDIAVSNNDEVVFLEVFSGG